MLREVNYMYPSLPLKDQCVGMKKESLKYGQDSFFYDLILLK